MIRTDKQCVLVSKLSLCEQRGDENPLKWLVALSQMVSDFVGSCDVTRRAAGVVLRHHGLVHPEMTHCPAGCSHIRGEPIPTIPPLVLTFFPPAILPLPSSVLSSSANRLMPCHCAETAARRDTETAPRGRNKYRQRVSLNNVPPAPSGQF